VHVHAGADAVAGVLRDDPVPGRSSPYVRLDGRGDVPHVDLRTYAREARSERPPGHVAERERLWGDRADSDGQRRVAVEPVDDRAEVDGDEVAVDEHPVARDAVDDLVVDRDADDGRVRRDAEAHVVVEEVRGGALTGKHLAGHDVEVRRRRTWLCRRRHLRERVRHDQPSTTHEAELVGALDLETGDGARHQTLTVSSAAAMRSVTSSTVPLPSTATMRPASTVVSQERPGGLAVDLHAVTDGRLVVVRTVLDLGALEHAGHEGLHVGFERDHRVEAPVAQDPVESLDLVDRPGEAVEQEAVGTVRLGQTLLDDGLGDLVRHVVAGVDDPLDLEPERRALGDVRAEDLPGGDRRDA
jgi:hypothetical protein